MARKNKVSVPKDLKKTWYKDYYNLTKEERTKLTDFYIKHLQAHELSGYSTKKLDSPFFMTQEDVLKKEEEARMDIEGAKKKEEEDKKEAELKEKHKLEWKVRAVLKLEEVERLRLENFQLKLELVEKALKETNAKKKDIKDAQIMFAERIENRLDIILDNYSIDLVTGMMARNPNVAYSEEDLKEK